MGISASGWSNKNGTSNRNCNCGSWKNHWLKFSKKIWPESCSVKECTNKATLGAHIINPNVDGERIVPMCDSCNQKNNIFTLKGKVNLPSANIAKTCGK